MRKEKSENRKKILSNTPQQIPQDNLHISHEITSVYLAYCRNILKFSQSILVESLINLLENSKPNFYDDFSFWINNHKNPEKNSKRQSYLLS